MKHLILAATAMSVVVSPALAHGPVDAQPVKYGLDGPEFDACGGWGRVANLNPQGDNFLAVRAAPSTQSSKLDQLEQGQEVWFCDGAKDGTWVGIVYKGEGQDDFECATGPNLEDAKVYPGPCRSGWVSSRFVQLLAG